MKTKIFVLKATCIALITMIGITMMILGFCDATGFHHNSAVYVSDQSYGGDAYTGIQNGVADTANNVGDVIRNIAAGAQMVYILGGALLMVVGVYLFACLLSQYSCPKVSENSNEDPVLVSIEKFRNLLDNGVITQEEFDAKKKQLLGL